jgi:hypothetical protein
MGGFEASSAPERGYTRPVRREPFAVWLLVLLPLPQLWQFPQPHSLALVPTLVIAAITGALGVVIAAADQRALLANLHVRRTSPWLALLPIVYLGVRGSRRFTEAGRGMTPFWVHLVIVLAVAFLLFWGPEGIIALFIF